MTAGTHDTHELRALTALVDEVVTGLGLSLYDLTFAGARGGRTLRVLLDGPSGVDLDRVTEATRTLSRALDDADVIDGSYVLEVSSPGIERVLRTPAHFRNAVGETVAVKFAGADGPARVLGELVGADDHEINVADAQSGTTRVIEIADIRSARTRFDWTPAPKPGKSARPGTARTHGPASAGEGDPKRHKESARS